MTTTPTPPQWGFPPPPPPPAPAPKPAFTPALIAALIASVAIAIGSSAPWASVVLFSVNGTAGNGGKFTLVVGLVAAAAVLVAALSKLQALGYGLALTAGVLAFGQGLYSVVKLTSMEKTNFFGAQIGAEVGWGLWLVLIASMALVVAASIAYKQAPK